MEYCKLQIGCLIVVLYIAFIYLMKCRNYKRKLKQSFFDELLTLGIVSILLDGATAYTVNHLDTVNPVINLVLHAFFLVGLDMVIFVFFLYMLNAVGTFPKTKRGKVLIFLPYIINLLVIVLNIGSLEYIKGVVTNYSMGVSVYACFIMVAIYVILSVFIFIRRWHSIKSQKRISILTYSLMLAAVTTLQMIFPEILFTSIAVTIFILGIYMNLEDPALEELAHFHNEMVMNFANLVENRDNNTGGHIKRTSRYVGLIAEEMRQNDYYSDVLTNDYIENLLKAAPMHDIGKISVPDAILQKPGKLTNEEFTIMKQHAANGGDIIRESFRNLGNEEYRRTAFEVARYHHEKWNGKGYPDGLIGNDIPLCARIMAVADVFDAVSEKRCYRDAMPLDKCFEIIAHGSGQDFDPRIAEVFLGIRDKVEQVHAELSSNSEQ